MAKRKNSVALFEVIHSDKRFGKKTQSAPSLRTPLWWFKGRAKEEAKAEVEAEAASDPTSKPAPAVAPVPPKKTLSKKLAAMIAPAKVERAAEPQPEFEEIAPPAFESKSEPEFEPPVDRKPSFAPEPDPEPDFDLAPLRKSVRGVDLAVDSDRQLISFKLTYTNAIIGGFAIVVIVILSFAIGRKLTAPAQPALSSMSSDTLRAQPPTDGVIDVGPTTPENPTPPAQPNTTTSPNVGTSNPPPKWEGPRAPENFTVTDQERQVGLNYVLVQSYPDDNNAIKARDALNQAGILCTVEQGIPGWPSTWYMVVGVKGFAKVRNSPEYEEYKAAIERVSRDYAKSSKWKKFEPQPISWKKAK